MFGIWYHYLNNKDKKNLLNNCTVEKENIIVCHETESRQYALYKSFSHLLGTIMNCEKQNKCYYEIITSNHSKKPYFDIDISFENIEEFLEEEFILNMHSIMKSEDFLEDKQLLIYSSNVKNKKSYHLVINKCYLDDEKELLNFYNFFIDKVDEKYKQFFDDKVYKTVQQFRILGCHKYRKENSKIFRKDLSYNYSVPSRHQVNGTAEFFYEMAISLITYTEGCEYLDGFKSKKIFENESVSIGSSSEEDLQVVLDFFYSDSDHSYDIFRFSSIKENNGNLLIILKRLQSSYCKICERVHEHENPYITVTGIDRHINFYCRRNEGKKYIGSLGPVVFNHEVTDEDISILKPLTDPTKFPYNNRSKVNLSSVTSLLYN